MNHFYLNQLYLNQFNMNLFHMNPFYVNQFHLNQFNMNQFYLNELHLNVFSHFQFVSSHSDTEYIFIQTLKTTLSTPWFYHHQHGSEIVNVVLEVSVLTYNQQ